MQLKKILIITGLVLAFSIVLMRFFGSNKSNDAVLLKTKVRQGLFENTIVASGELRAENSVEITIPPEILRGRVRIYDIKITDMIEEGTLVDSGDYVASLDHSAIMERIEASEADLLEDYQNLDNAKMDTNLNLTNARNNLMSDEDDVEEQRIVLEQSVYESPSVQRQAQMNLERAQRRWDQNIKAYDLNVRKSEQRIAQIQSAIKRSKDEIDEYKKIFESLRIKAPKKGMFIYSRDRHGNKLTVGTMVSRYYPRIAELPDLSSLISRTYVNEVDISRIKVGQLVTVGVDAFPEKSLSAEVINVSNIGQSIDNNTKVFEVDIRLNEVDSLLKPAMTTSNAIKTESIPDALYVQIDAVFSNDSLHYVYPFRKNERRIVQIGVENENYVVIEKGLNKGDKLLLLPPEGSENFEWTGIEIYEEMLKNKALVDTLELTHNL